MIEIHLTKRADKSSRRFDKALRLRILSALQEIQLQPETTGEKLSSPLTGVYAYRLTYQGKEYRIAYQICPAVNRIVILMIGSHENFYKRLQKFLYAF